MAEHIGRFGVVALHAEIDVDTAQALRDRPLEQRNNMLRGDPDQQVERAPLLVRLDLQYRRVTVDQQFEISLFRHDW